MHERFSDKARQKRADAKNFNLPLFFLVAMFLFRSLLYYPFCTVLIPLSKSP